MAGRQRILAYAHDSLAHIHDGFPVAEVVASEAGDFALSGLGAGAYWILAVGDDASSLPIAIELQTGQPLEVNLRLIQDAPLAGRVVDSKNAEGIHGAIVRGSLGRAAVTDEAGMFRLFVPPGVDYLSVSAEGYEDGWLKLSGADGLALRALLAPLRLVAGNVVQPGGTATAHVTVLSVRERDAETEIAEATSRTDARGGFELRGAAEEADRVEIICVVPGWGRGSVVLSGASVVSGKPAEMPVLPHGSYSVRVLATGSDAPVVGAVVRILDPAPTLISSEHFDGRAHDFPRSLVQVYRTDSEGEVEVQESSGTRAIVEILTEHSVAREMLVFTPGAKSHTVRVRAGGPSQLIRGLVLDKNSFPVAGEVTMVSVGDTTRVWTVRSGDNGAFVFDSRPQQGVALRARLRDGSESASVPLSGGEGRFLVLVCDE